MGKLVVEVLVRRKDRDVSIAYIQWLLSRLDSTRPGWPAAVVLGRRKTGFLGVSGVLAGMGFARQSRWGQKERGKRSTEPQSLLLRKGQAVKQILGKIIRVSCLSD